jgi:hypothetical protein
MIDDIIALRAARNLIASKGMWVQRFLAQDVKGNIVAPHKASATCFCAAGALRRTTGHPFEGTKQYGRLLGELVETLNLGYKKDLPVEVLESVVANYNDTHPHVDVLNLFNKTIIRLERPYNVMFWLIATAITGLMILNAIRWF